MTFIMKQEIITTKPENLEVLLIIFAIYDTKSLKKFLQYFITAQHDYHFIIKKLAEEFKGEFECLGENTEKYITFSVPLKKESNNSKKITYKLKFIDSYRFMSTSLSNLVDNLSGIYFKECKKCMERKKIGLHYEFIRFKNDRLNYRCKECKHSCYKSKLKQFKIFRLCINFAIVISINFFCF